ncbi:MAG: hypothetical protein NTX79_01230 [Candidatus Micrarchaeota archaeon]|nr:hypothetical protein [Candidatus Micrarchaeota archaeon]
MGKLSVFYAPTNANGLVVSKLERLRGFDKFKFIKLPENQAERIAFLQKIPCEERAAFIWGDGNSHHESYYFTMSKNMQFKINIDDHDDGFPHILLHLVPEQDNGLWLARQSWAMEVGECCLVREVLWNNHMKATFEQGKDTMTEVNTDGRLDRAAKFALEYPNRSGALTVDSDGLICFPCLGKWTTTTGVSPSRLIATIEAISAKLIRLDIGGLVERIVDFALVDVDLAKSPTLDESRAFAMAASGGKVPGYVITEARLNYVGSYAVFAYAGLLESFAKP